MAAIGRSEVDNEPQLARGVIDILSLKRTLFRFVRPGEAFVQVQPTIDDARGKDQAPAHSLQQLLEPNKEDE